MKRGLVPGVPFGLSLCLSLVTVGTHPFWQDSGLYLTAVQELGVLYPPGFVLYELLCRMWTLLFFFVDFTLAVHPENRATALCYLGGIARKKGDQETAQRMFDEALAVPGVDPAFLRAIEAQILRR